MVRVSSSRLERGGEAEQAWTLVVGDDPYGHPPAITSLPGATVNVGGLYAYVPQARDLDGDTLTWLVGAHPTGSAIDTTTGRVLWTPTAEQVGSHAFELGASDGDNVATQRWTVTVVEAPPNAPPVFTSVPHLAAEVGTPWTYAAKAVDPEGERLTYALFSGPSGVTVDAATGVLSFTPSATGAVPLVIRAEDPLGAAALQSWVVIVRADNGAPTVWTDPVPPIPVDVPWTHRVYASDPDHDAVTFSLATAPYGMTIDPTSGVLAWTPKNDNESVTVVVVATDPVGATGSTELAITPVIDDQPPTVEVLVASDGVSCAGGTGTVCVRALDAVSPIAWTALSVGGVPKVLDTSGCVEVTWGTAGTPVALVGSSADKSGNRTSTTLTVTPETCPDYRPFPLVDITSPGDAARVASPVAVRADALPSTDATAITSWQAWLFRTSTETGLPADAIALGEGEGDLPDVLGTIDPTQLANGLWVLRVVATDDDLKQGWSDVAVRIEGDLKPGRYQVAFEDARITLPTGDLTVTRTYDTLDRQRDGDFGYGWRLQLADVRVETNGPLGSAGWGRGVCGGLFGMPNYCFASAKPRVVAVTWPNGRVDLFDMGLAPTNLLAPYLTKPTFTARPGTTSTLAVAPGDPALFAFYGGDGTIKTGVSGTGGLLAPKRYVLTTSDGTKLVLDRDDGLVSLTDRFGNSTEIGPDGVVARLGTTSTTATIAFHRDAAGRIDRLDLPDDRSVVYTYDASGDLVAHDEPHKAGDDPARRTTFDYDTGHRLVAWGGDGLPPTAALHYDEDGRLDRSEDATGVFATEAFDAANLKVTTTEGATGLQTIERYAANGLLTSVDVTDNSEHHVTAFGYDDKFRTNVIVHPEGAVETIAYDTKGRVLTHRDQGGMKSSFTYGPYDQVDQTWTNDQLVSDTTFTSKGQVEAVNRPDGSLIQGFGYDDVGRVVRVQNGTDQIVTLAYAGFHPTLIMAPGDIHVVVEYDAHGRKTKVSRPEVGETWNQYVYDEAGRTTALIDGRLRLQSFEYDALGRQTVYRDKLGHEVHYAYDDAGRLATLTNRRGQVVAYAYDDAGRLTSVVTPDVEVADGGVDRSFTYDAFGRMTSAVADDGHTTTYAHDVTGLRRTRAYHPTDARHADVTMDYTNDTSGRVADLGMGARHTLYGYVGGRLTTVQDSAIAGSFSYAWNADGTLGTLTRPGGSIVTAYGYDGARRVTSIATTAGGSPVHALGYNYDATRGHLASMTDAFGVHIYQHDDRGRLTAADHPTGFPLPNESYTYDVAFRRTSSAGNPIGEVVHNDGDQLVQDATYTYTYDLDGNRLARVARSGGSTPPTTTYTFNALNQLVALDDPEKGAWVFAYDGEDRRVLVGSETHVWTFAYDSHALARTMTEDGEIIETYATGVGFGEVLARVDQVGGAALPIWDKLGTVVAWLAPTGTMVETVPRDSYGFRQSSPVAPVAYGFTGHAEDPAGLIWGRARYFDSGTGYFISEDLIDGTARYSYSDSRPDSASDPTGLMAEPGLTLRQAVCNAMAHARPSTKTILVMYRGVIVTVNIAHILAGENMGKGGSSNGGHQWPGRPGKTPFPKGEDPISSIEKVLDTYFDAATKWCAANKGQPYEKGEGKNGVDVIGSRPPNKPDVTAGYPRR